VLENTFEQQLHAEEAWRDDPAVLLLRADQLIE
jgi:hypothetical protein